MNNLAQALKRFASEEQGVTMLEYALVGALIAVVCVVAITAVGGNTRALYEAVCQAVNDAVPGPALPCQ